MSELSSKQQESPRVRGYSRLPFDKVDSVLKQFYGQYKSLFENGRLLLFAPIYYPVVTMELELLERASEEFDTIEHTVLMLYEAGMNRPESICEVMGLPLNYMNRIIDILHSYGHIDKGIMTELGKASAETGVKFLDDLVRQKVQGDTCSGLLFGRHMIQSNNDLLLPNQTKLEYPMVRPNAHLSWAALERLDQVIERYRSRGDESIFNVNILKVNQVLQSEVRYTYGFLVQFNHIRNPFVILRCKEQNGKSVRYYWMPTALIDSGEELGPELDDIERVSGEHLGSLVQTAQDLEAALNEQLAKEGYQRRLTRIMEREFGPRAVFQFQGCALNVKIDGEQPLPLTWEIMRSIEAISSSIRGVPMALYLMDDALQSTICYVHSDSQHLVRLSETIRSLKERNSDFRLYRDIKERLGAERKTVTVEELQQFVETL